MSQLDTGQYPTCNTYFLRNCVELCCKAGTSTFGIFFPSREARILEMKRDTCKSTRLACRFLDNQRLFRLFAFLGHLAQADMLEARPNQAHGNNC